jgi:hypothetical protein
MSDAGGAAFNPAVRTEDGPLPDDEQQPPVVDDDGCDQTDNDRISGEDQG